MSLSSNLRTKICSPQFCAMARDVRSTVSTLDSSQSEMTCFEVRSKHFLSGTTLDACRRWTPLAINWPVSTPNASSHAFGGYRNQLMRSATTGLTEPSSNRSRPGVKQPLEAPNNHKWTEWGHLGLGLNERVGASRLRSGHPMCSSAGRMFLSGGGVSRHSKTQQPAAAFALFAANCLQRCHVSRPAKLGMAQDHVKG